MYYRLESDKKARNCLLKIQIFWLEKLVDNIKYWCSLFKG